MLLSSSSGFGILNIMSVYKEDTINYFNIASESKKSKGYVDLST